VFLVNSRLGLFTAATSRLGENLTR